MVPRPIATQFTEVGRYMPELKILARRSNRLFDLAEKIAVRMFLLLEVVKHLFFQK